VHEHVQHVWRTPAGDDAMLAYEALVGKVVVL
jgi:hypothetical protein